MAEQFELLLQQLLSPENDVRTPAETAYDAITPAQKVPLLIQALRTSPSAEHRTMAAVLLRRLFTNTFEDFWPGLGTEIHGVVKQELLLAVQNDAVDSVRRKICDALSELARNLFDENGNNLWPEVLKFLFELANSENPALRQSAFHVFGAVPGIFGNQQGLYIDVIKQMLSRAIADVANPRVRLEAIKAATSFIVANGTENHLTAMFKELIPSYMGAVNDILNADIDGEDEVLKCVIELAENCPKVLRSQLEPLVQLCLKVMDDANVENSQRHLALEIIVSLCETAPAMVRKQAQLLKPVIHQVLQLMVDLDDDEEWAMQDEDEDEDSESNPVVAESAIDRIALGLGGKTILPHITANIPLMLSNADWRYRHAALMAMSAIGEGCHKQMLNVLNQIVDAVLPMLQDQHPRVRYAACNAIGQLSTDFAPQIEKKFHDRIIPGLLIILDDAAHPRVQAHAGAALVNFAEECPKSILAGYLDAIIAKLEQVLSTKFQELVEKGSKLVLEQVVTTIAAVADTAEDQFLAYYDRFMPCLKYIMQNANTPDYRLLRGKTIECISLIGLAVGREKFMADCQEVMELLLRTQTEEADLEDDDPQVSYMISAWARMCKILGKDFTQYLPLVMPPLLKTAAMKPEVAIFDSEDNQKDMNEVDGWEFVTLGDQQSFGIKTAGLDDKSTACQMLVCYAKELKEGFADYVQETVQLLVPLLKFYLHDNVRIAAAESLPFLIESGKAKGEAFLKEVWSYIVVELLKAIETEHNNDVLGEELHSLGKCIEILGTGCLTEEQMNEVIKVVQKTVEEHLEREIERQSRRKDEDYDDEVEETLVNEDDEDVYVLSKIADVMHALFVAYRESLFPVFEVLLPTFAKLLAPDRNWSDRQWGICVFDDLIEFGGPPSFKYHEAFLPTLVNGIVDKSAEVRQASSYGVGIMAQCGGEPYVDAIRQSLPLLVQVINDPSARDQANINSTENCIAAVTKVMKYVPTATNLEETIPHWLSWLPVWEDDEEAKHIYGYFCELIEANNPHMLGANNANLPRLVSIMAEVLVRKVIPSDDPLHARICTIIQTLKNSWEHFQACANMLSEPQKLALQTVLG